MSKRMVRIGLICALALSIAAVVVAQQTPTPVVRMGDWVEIGDDAWMNITGNIDARYITWHNSDFEDDVQDTVGERNPTSSTVTGGIGDLFEAEIRFGADFRYKKRLNTRILFETQSVFDGNLIDDQGNNQALAEPDRGIDDGDQNAGNSPHVERFWIDYQWNDVIRTRVGADLWKVDQFGLLGDDDPSFAVFITPSPDLQFHARAAIQTESQRIGLTNDNDDLYYTFGARYTGMKGHTFQLDGAYFRFRLDPSEDVDTFIIIPNYEGNIGPVRLTALFAAVFGEVDGTGGEDYDVAGFAFMAHAVANLGKFRPFAGFVFGSADDDAADNDLNGFHHFPHARLPWVAATSSGVSSLPARRSGDRAQAPMRASVAVFSAPARPVICSSIV